VTLRPVKKESPTTLSESDKNFVKNMVSNEVVSRSALLNKLIDPRRDIDDECGYPKSITTDMYRLLYDREGIATRVVQIFPEESWADDPRIIENEDTDNTEFEEAWAQVERDKNLNFYMMKADELSGIGRFGIILLGINDGKELNKPVEGINERGERTGNQNYELLYLRAFDESVLKIEACENDVTNPRYGKPIMYSVTFEENTASSKNGGDLGSVKSTGKEIKVHWTRCIHIADNRKSSEVYGIPRMQSLFNRLYDLRKIMGGSGEMFWKGGFPGYAFEMDPNAKSPTDEENTAITEQITSYANGLQRYLRLQGISVNSLNPQVAEPKAHVDVQLEIIAIAMGVPKRIFMGSEQAKLASEKDIENWNKRVKRRQNKYLSPYVVRPLIERLIAFGILPEVENYFIEWPDLATPSERDKAEVLKAQVEAFSKYVGGNVDMLIPPEVFFKMFMGLSEAEIKEIMDQAEERQKEFEEEQAELMGGEEDIPNPERDNNTEEEINGNE